MTDLLSAWMTIVFAVTCWVYAREAMFQKSQAAGGTNSARDASIQAAYIAIAAATVSSAYRLFFVAVGIPSIMAMVGDGNASQLLLSVVFLVLICGGHLLIERAARGVSLFVVDRKLHLNRMPMSLFAADTAKGLLISAAFGVPLVAGWSWLMQSDSGPWWFSAWALWFALLSIRMLVKPQIETLLFSAQRELPQGLLRSRLENLLQRCGITVGSLHVVEASRRTGRVNASVTGLGANKKIFLHDTLVEQLSAGEVEAVVAHEAGHIHHRHLGKAWAGLGVLGLASAYAIAQAVDVAKLAPAEAIGLVLAAYPTAMLCLRPVMVRISRSFEFQADAYAAKHCGATALQAALRKIFAANHGVWEHDWIYASVFASHPSGRERILRLL